MPAQRCIQTISCSRPFSTRCAAWFSLERYFLFSPLANIELCNPRARPPPHESHRFVHGSCHRSRAASRHHDCRRRGRTSDREFGRAGTIRSAHARPRSGDVAAHGAAPQNGHAASRFQRGAQHQSARRNSTTRPCQAQARSHELAVAQLGGRPRNRRSHGVGTDRAANLAHLRIRAARPCRLHGGGPRTGTRRRRAQSPATRHHWRGQPPRRRGRDERRRRTQIAGA